MITELMLLLIVLGSGIVFIAWSNTRRRKQDALERREVEDSTGKLKQELERTANEIIGRMENHVTHLESVLEESERNRTQLEGRVSELKKLLKKGEGQSGEIRDLLARLDDAGAEVTSMQRKMDVVERKLNLAMTTPLPIQQPVSIPQMTAPLVPPIIPQNVSPITPPPLVQRNAPPAPITPIKNQSAAQITTPPPEPINPLGPITMPQITRPAQPAPKAEVESKDFDKILEESIAEPKTEKPPQPRKSIVLSPENKQPVTVVEADPVKIEATRKKLTEVSAELAKNSSGKSDDNQAQALQKKRRGSRSGRDVRKAAVEAIKAAEKSNSTESTPPPKPEKEILPERRDLKLETTNSAIIKEMLLSGMSIEDISRETGLGRNAIELVQRLTRRQLERR